MSFKEVKELRKSGNLSDAYQLAQNDLAAAPDEIWNKRSLAWVLNDYLKENVLNKDRSVFLNYLNEFNAINLPAAEVMIFENVGWQLIKFLFDISRQPNHNNADLDVVFVALKNIHYPKPSEIHSALLKAVLKFQESWPNFISFIDWWNLGNLRNEDYLPEEFKEGQKNLSVAERVFIANAKLLLKKKQSIVELDGMQLLGSYKIDREAIISFIPKLDNLIESHPEFQYPPYYKAKLLLALGNDENILEAFLPFAKKKKNEFWVWNLLAEIFTNDKNKQIACYCKALSCRTPPEFLVKTRYEFAKLLIKEGTYNEAKTEIELLVEVKKHEGWKIPAEVTNWQSQEWYKSARNFQNNFQFYKNYLSEAEEILFQDIEPEVAVVEFVNTEKKLLYYIVNKDVSGNFKYQGHLKNPKVGDFIKIRFEKKTSRETGEVFYQILTAEPTIERPSRVVFREFQGQLSKKEGQNFGFADNVFIAPELLAQFSKEFKEIRGNAILSFNKKRSEWGWKAISVE